MNDALFIGALRLLPKNAWSRAVGAAATAPLPAPSTARPSGPSPGPTRSTWTRPIGLWTTTGRWGVFTRRLRPGARPIDRRPGFAVSPADGHLQQRAHRGWHPHPGQGRHSPWPTCSRTTPRGAGSRGDPG
ncbi:MAG: phosphatidylserine decarboxylase [bacterium]